MAKKAMNLGGQLGQPETRGVVEVYPCSYGGIPVAWAGVTIANEFAFLSGTEGWDIETMVVAPSIERQAWLCLEKIRDRFEAVGTAMENVVNMVTYVTNMADYFREVRPVIRKFYQENWPQALEAGRINTLIQVGALARKEMKIEIDAIAAMPSKSNKRNAMVKSYPLEYSGVRMPWCKGTVANDLAFLSPTEGIDPLTLEVVPVLEDQAWMCLEKVYKRLNEMGTSIANIVKMRIYVTDADAFYREVWGPGRSFWRFYNKYLPDTPKEFPPISLVKVAGLPRKEMKIAISAIAAVPKSGPKNKSVVKYYHLEDEPWASGAIANRFAFLSLADGYDFRRLTMADSFEQQTWDALENMSERLKDMGTSLDNIVMCTSINTSMNEYFREPSKYRRKFEREKYPSVNKLSFSATLLEMPAVERKDAKMAFDVFAAIP